MNRAVSAYQNGLAFGQPKMLWPHPAAEGLGAFPATAYRAAVQTFVEYLKLKQRAPDQAADIGEYLLREIHKTIASSLTYVDFDGAPAGDPFIPRRESVDVERNPARGRAGAYGRDHSRPRPPASSLKTSPGFRRVSSARRPVRGAGSRSAMPSPPSS